MATTSKPAAEQDLLLPSNAQPLRALGNDLGLLLLRLVSGGLMMGLHGWSKWLGWSEKSAKFADPLHIGKPMSLALAIFAEVICAGLLMLGLGTRLAALVLTINFAVISFIVHGADPVADKELALFYLAVYFVLALTGPGRFSIDAMIEKGLKKRRARRL